MNAARSRGGGVLRARLAWPSCRPVLGSCAEESSSRPSGFQLDNGNKKKKRAHLRDQGDAGAGTALGRRWARARPCSRRSATCCGRSASCSARPFWMNDAEGTRSG